MMNRVLPPRLTDKIQDDREYAEALRALCEHFDLTAAILGKEGRPGELTEQMKRDRCCMR